MKKIISFEKKLDFPSMIGEITAISLDNTLKFIDQSNIKGDFIVYGTYKLTEASRLEEEFKFEVPTEILLNEKLDLTTATIDIDDFYYEIENDDTMICHIDVKIEGVEDIQIEDLEEPALKGAIDEEIKLDDLDDLNEITEPDICEKIERECDGDYHEEKEEETIEDSLQEKQAAVGSLFSSFKDSDETFATYSVYILRQEETIPSLIEKYKTTKEELEMYNDLANLTIGTKIILPTRNE